MLYHEYKVLKEFVTFNGSIKTPGSRITFCKSEYQRNKYYIDGLNGHGFIEPIKDEPEFGVIATSKLAHVEIADENYTEDGKEYFTFDEALEVEKKMQSTGWRLPTRHEWVLICEEFGVDEQMNLNADALMKNLGLAMRGYSIPNAEAKFVGQEGNYWSRSANPTDVTLAYYLYFYASAVNPSLNDDRWYGFSLRLVRDVKENGNE